MMSRLFDLKIISTTEHHWLFLGIASATLVGVGLLPSDHPIAHGVFCMAASAAESSVEEGGSFDMFPGVTADSASERLYLMNPQGGIDAIGLASGNLLWTSRAAHKPLAVFDDRLAAQADPTGGSNFLPIILLETNSGRVVSNIARGGSQDGNSNLDAGAARYVVQRIVSATFVIL
jgi:hypothetical protein